MNKYGPTSKYDLTAEAELDLDEIVEYTLETWGEQILDKYLSGMDRIFESIGSGKIIKRKFNNSIPDLYLVKYERHFVYFVERGHDKSPLIVAVLHEKMNLNERIKQRLNL